MPSLVQLDDDAWETILRALSVRDCVQLLRTCGAVAATVGTHLRGTQRLVDRYAGPGARVQVLLQHPRSWRVRVISTDARGATQTLTRTCHYRPHTVSLCDASNVVHVQLREANATLEHISPRRSLYALHAVTRTICRG